MQTDTTDGLLPHTCSIQKRYRKQKFSYTGSTGSPSVGITVTGSTSHKTAVVSRVGSGYMVVKDLSGVFTTGEKLTASTFTATLSAQADWQNQSNEYEYYWSDDQTLVNCLFYYASGGKGLTIHETGQLLDQPAKVMLPNTIVLAGAQAAWAEEYRIVSTTPGFVGTWQIVTPYALTGIDEIDHYEAILKAVTV
jgi:hypothetical protein